jgi:hypothetical protein
MEQEPGPRDPRVPVNEGDLTEDAGTLVGVDLSTRSLGADAAVTPVMRPPRNMTFSPSTTTPPMITGFVRLITPSARRRSGLVKTSSVGIFARYVMPSGSSMEPPVHRASGASPTVKSVSAPRYVGDLRTPDRAVGPVDLNQQAPRLRRTPRSVICPAPKWTWVRNQETILFL